MGLVCRPAALPNEEAVVSVPQIGPMTKRWPRLCDRRVRTKKEAVNLAMRDCVERFRRVETLARSREQAKGWDYEG
jgi:predicted phage tail protein